MPSPKVYKERRSAGLCPLCGGQPDSSFVICGVCRAGERSSLHEKRARLKSEGKCGSCCHPLESTTHKEKCVDYKIAWRQRIVEAGMCARCRRRARGAKSSMCAECLLKSRTRKAAIRKKVLDHYGAFCACCGETQIEFLQIDHVDGGGSKHRKSTRDICKWLVDNHFPSGFKTLCSNCNFGKHINGGICPKTTHAGRFSTAASGWSDRASG